MNILITEIELRVIQYHITNCILLHTVYITREIKSLCFTYGNPAIVYVMHDCIYVMSDMTNSKVPQNKAQLQRVYQRFGALK